jgi:hypothetical protein
MQHDCEANWGLASLNEKGFRRHKLLITETGRVYQYSRLDGSYPGTWVQHLITRYCPAFLLLVMVMVMTNEVGASWEGRNSLSLILSYMGLRPPDPLIARRPTPRKNRYHQQLENGE